MNNPAMKNTLKLKTKSLKRSINRLRINRAGPMLWCINTRVSHSSTCQTSPGLSLTWLPVWPCGSSPTFTLQSSQELIQSLPPRTDTAQLPITAAKRSRRLSAASHSVDRSFTRLEPRVQSPGEARSLSVAQAPLDVFHKTPWSDLKAVTPLTWKQALCSVCSSGEWRSSAAFLLGDGTCSSRPQTHAAYQHRSGISGPSVTQQDRQKADLPKPIWFDSAFLFCVLFEALIHKEINM